MGLFSFTLAGAGFILIGAWESLRSSTSTSTHPVNSSQSPNPKSSIRKEIPDATSSSSSLTFAAVCIFSFLFIADSLVSLFNAVDSNDGIGSALQLQILSISAVFFLYSVLGLAKPISSSFLSFFLLFLLLLLLRRRSSFPVRRILHQPFFPHDSSLPPSPSPSPSSLPPPQPPAKLPFSSTTPTTTATPNSPFFPTYPSPPPPPSPANFASFPANIASLILPQSSSPKPSSSHKLIALSLSFLLAAVIVSSILVF